MKLISQTNYQLFVITNLNKEEVNGEWIELAKAELSQRKLSDIELKSLNLQYESEYPSDGEREGLKHSKLMGVLLISLGTFLSPIIYMLPIAIFVFLVGTYYILDSNLDKTKKWIIIGVPILLVILLYFLVLPCM